MNDASAPLDEEPSKSSAVINYRVQQISCLEKLQRVLDESDALRAKFNALQTQVSPPEVGPEPSSRPILDPILSPEEREAVHAQLDQTLAAYRHEVALAGRLNQALERQHRSFSELKMSMRVLQDKRITSQNEAAEGQLAGFQGRAQRLRENWGFERQRLTGLLNYLRGVHLVSAADQKEYEEQQKSNLKGISHLTDSIAVAEQDIRDLNKQQESMQKQLAEYERLQEEHQSGELALVQLSDKLDSLKKKVETDSLMANVRKQMEESRQKIEELNSSIDDIHAKVSRLTVECQESHDRITELDGRQVAATREIKDIRGLIQQLAKQREMLRRALAKCYQASNATGGENIMLTKAIESGFASDNEPPWKIRKKMLLLKGELMELNTLEEAQHDFEAQLESPNVPPIQLPTRKRVALIPITKKGKK
jgi:DNA repair exonuclease SbcCD ATPase subunit